MLREVRFYPLLRGARGGTAVSLQALSRLLLTLRAWPCACPGWPGPNSRPCWPGGRAYSWPVRA